MKKRLKSPIAVILASVIVLSGAFVSASAASFETEMLNKGFPASYTKLLSALHRDHPYWQFEPVLVTSMNSQYTFDYVVSQEDVGSRNLVTTSSWAPSPWTSAGNANYSPYYHPDDTTLYDSGWRRASNAAVRYFLDPRNFLNDVDVFIFESLEYNFGIHTLERVGNTLSGSFMGNGAACDNGISYAQHIFNCGVQYNVSPVALAGRLKQEQGVGNSPLVKGTLGTTLYNYYINKPDTDGRSPVWGSVKKTDVFDTAALLGYDGLYNFFNIGASGNGRFAIYLNAAKEAASGGWNTKAKAITGGAEKFAQKYVGGYQYTLYFQKFNTDPRSTRNFWGQYMQNIAGALTEGRTARKTYADSGILERAFVFKIPVYGGMPDSPCPDPAGGNSYYSPSASTGPTIFSLQATVSGGNGVVHFGNNVTSAQVAAGTLINFGTTPADGYKVSKILINGVETAVNNGGADCVYQFIMPAANTVVSVTFEKALYTVTAKVSSGNGVVHFGNNVTSAQVAAGTLINFGTTPADGYKVSKIIINNVETAVLNGGAEYVYQFTMPAANTVVSVEFEKIPITVTVHSYYAQCGEFNSSEEAQELISRLKAAGIAYGVLTHNNKYIVYAGQFYIKSNAENRVAALTEAGFDSKIFERTLQSGADSTVGFDSQTDTVPTRLGGELSAIPVPVKEFCRFKGYYTGKNGTGTKYYGEDGIAVRTYEQSGDRTLYALWETNCTVRHYRQKLNGKASLQNDGNYTLEEESIISANVGSKISPARNTYRGFFTPDIKTVTVSDGGGTVINYYYMLKYGDINDDDEINAADIAALKRALLENGTLGDRAKVLADANGDGVIGIGDLLRLKSYIADNSVTLGS